ncbi:hypothetical protein E2562_004574 [Oryza meyeriana var. granulata]|uniref:DUF834 domain-containing protein n=1 Tax=Oryza meyeriana var. granulata TaxID=110450 RepID=A0A6G1F3H6_9ORYZ|nr:hypothetical protein E2562_004574 [Oryza meyeriana var. granulata]
MAWRQGGQRKTGFRSREQLGGSSREEDEKEVVEAGVDGRGVVCGRGMLVVVVQGEVVLQEGREEMG